MKTFITMLCVAASTLSFNNLYAADLDVDSVASCLMSKSRYVAAVKYEVLLPTSEFPVTYDIVMQSTATPDTLATANYLIEWSLSKDGNTSSGFSTYFSGNHYRYRDERLQEYHTEWDAQPFAPMGKVADGVQNQAQFCDIFPQAIGARLKEMASDPTYRFKVHADTIVNSRRAVVVDGVRSFQGIDALEFEYVFDYDDVNPRRIEFDSNPGQISEQIITVEYRPAAEREFVDISSEDDLIVRYPDVFARFRESSFRLDNLPGRRLPAFSVPTTVGERYTHHRDDGFEAPVVIAILDTEVSTTEDMIKMLRSAADMMPMSADVIFAFVGNNVDRIGQVAGDARPGEYMLVGARGLARDCGVTATPVVMICDRDARVVNILNGYNKDVTDFVIQQMAVAAK